MNWLTTYTRLYESGEPFVLVTVVESSGSAPREVGARCFVTPDGRLEGTIGGGTLEEEARIESLSLLTHVGRAESAGDKPPRAFTREYGLDEVLGQCCGGRIRLLFEPVLSPERLYIFGAGHVGLALARVLADSRLEVTVLDPRPEYADPRRFPSGVEVLAVDVLQILPELLMNDSRTHIVILTHSHCLDERILEHVLRRPTRYVGLIGSRAKWVKFRRELGKTGIPESALDRVQCPVGLPLGDKRPAEVAVSIAAEILSQLPRTSRGLDAKARTKDRSATRSPDVSLDV